ncbi:hypothetical protein Tco_1504751 [Tanacetum coccineum]
MVDENVPAPAPTTSDDQILPCAAWVPIGKSNYNTLTYEAKTRAYSFQLDETLSILDANLLREALEITPIDQAHQFVSPSLGDAIMDFVNELGYTETSRHDRPRYPVLQMFGELLQVLMLTMLNLCGKNLYKLSRLFLLIRPIWAVPLRKAGKTSLTSASPFHLAEEDLRLSNLKFVSKGKVDEVFGMPIPNEPISNNIRNAPYYNAYLEMVAKHDKKVVAKKEGKKKTASAKQPKPKPAKEKPSKPSTAKPPKPKPAKEKSTKATPLQKAGKGKVAKVHNVKSSFKLVDELDEEPTQPEPEPEHQGEGEEYDVERAIQMSLESFHEGHAHVGGVAIREPVAEATRPLPVVEGNGKAIATEEEAA